MLRKRSWRNLYYYLRIFMEGQRKTTKPSFMVAGFRAHTSVQFSLTMRGFLVSLIAELPSADHRGEQLVTLNICVSFSWLNLSSLRNTLMSTWAYKNKGVVVYVSEQLHQRCQVALLRECLSFIARETPKIALAVLCASYLCTKGCSYFTEFWVLCDLKFEFITLATTKIDDR
jgi:hypothetical protein